MSRLDPPQVLVDSSALAAIADPEHEHHAAVAAAYRALVEEYRAERILLVAVDRHLRPYDITAGESAWADAGWFALRPRTGVFAPIDPLRVGFQHVRHARRMAEAVADPEFALTLLMCARHGVRRVLTVDERWAVYDLERVALALTPEG